MTDKYDAWTVDVQYGLSIPCEVLDRMLALCENSEGIETGGIFVGHYSSGHDCAIVTDCSSAPQDSSAGITHFYRGIKGLKKWLLRLWRGREKQYYLGEWHYHPKGSPAPSSTDIKQMKKIASDPSYHCPEPVLFIIGGDSSNGWLYEAVVYIRGVGVKMLYLKEADC